MVRAGGGVASDSMLIRGDGLSGTGDSNSFGGWAFLSRLRRSRLLLRAALDSLLGEGNFMVVFKFLGGVFWLSLGLFLVDWVLPGGELEASPLPLLPFR